MNFRTYKLINLQHARADSPTERKENAYDNYVYFFPILPAVFPVFLMQDAKYVCLITRKFIVVLTDNPSNCLHLMFQIALFTPVSRDLRGLYATSCPPNGVGTRVFRNA